MFYRGQKVVCIDDSRPDRGFVGRIIVWLFGRDWPKKGEVYTVLRAYVALADSQIGIELDEIKNVALLQRCFRQSRFRPLVSIKTDVSVFTKILRSSKQEELV